MDPIPFALPDTGKEEIDAVTRVIASGWLTTGSECLAFEKEFAEAAGVKNALAVNSATAGLHLALEAVGVRQGMRVITTPYTFTATAEVIRYLGAEVEFVDILPDQPLIDPAGVDETIRRLTREGVPVGAVVVVHYGGQVCDMPAIRRATEPHGIPVVEDAAHSYPSLTSVGKAGTLGTVGIFSFYATKPLTTGEGGMICTDRNDLAARMQTMRLHGIDREAWDRYRRPGAGWYYQVVDAGYKYNMPDLMAAIGRVQLKRAEAMHRRRVEIAEYYLQELSDLEFLTLPRRANGHAWHLFPIDVHSERLGLSRDDVIELLREAGIGTSVHYIPLHLMPYYAGRYGFGPESFPNSLRRFQGTISIPLFSRMTDEQCKRVVAAIRALPDNGP